MSNLPLRPIAFSDHIDKSRDIIGLNKWTQSSRTVGFIMFILGWFTIPAEVLLRRDFGQRWFTVVNFYAGFFVLLVFTLLQYITAAFWAFLTRIGNSLNPFHTEQQDTSSVDSIIENSMLLILMAYVVMGSYHLFKIWWRNRTNTALHSYNDGTSRTERLAGYLMRVLNGLTIPFVHIYSWMLPKTQRKGIKVPKLINDRTAFTNTVFEPLLLLLLAWWLHGIVSMWLLISAIALAIHANWKETSKLNKILDFRDSIVEAKAIMQLKEETEQASPAQAIIQQAAATIRSNPQVAPQLAQQYPNLMDIIEEMNREVTPPTERHETVLA